MDLSKRPYLNAFAALLALCMLAGCDNDREPDAANAASPAIIPAGNKNVEPAPRPDVLNQASEEVREGKFTEAQQRLEEFLSQEPKKSPFRAEALYILGQSQSGANDFETAKKNYDLSIDLAEDRSLKALAMLGRADCNMQLRKYQLASRQYHWIETMYRDVRSVQPDELLFKLGLATKMGGTRDVADYWFKQVIELYAQSPYAERAKQEHSLYTPDDASKKPLVYTLEVTHFSKLAKAEAEAQILRDKGYRDVQVISTTRFALPAHEVHMGKFGNQADVIRAQTDAELAGLKTTIRPSLIQPLR